MRPFQQHCAESPVRFGVGWSGCGQFNETHLIDTIVIGMFIVHRFDHDRFNFEHLLEIIINKNHNTYLLSHIQ